MVQPYDYTLDIQNPVDTLTNSLWRGYQLGASVEQVQKQREQEALQKQAELQRQQDTRTLIQNPTDENFTSFQLMYPSQAETIQKVWERKSQADKDLSWRIGSEALAALSNKNPEIAKEVLNNAASAYENSGKKQDAGSMRFYANLIDKNPENAQTLMQGYLSTVDREKFDKTFEQFNTQNRANEKQPYELKQIAANTAKTSAETQGQVIENRYKPQQIQTGINQTQSQTALNYASIQNMAEQRQLDRDKLETETSLKLQELNPSNIKLSDGAQKLVNDNMIGSVASEQAASQQLDLANRIQAAGGGAGRFSSWNEKLKELTGNQDSLTNLRNEYTRIRNSQAIKMLPPGPATDKDIEMALKGFPPETADSKTISSFLRGMAKMNQRDAAYQQMQAEWVNQVGNMGSTKRDVEILGVKVPAGTTFSGYATKNIGKALKHQASQAVDRQIATGTRSYMSAVQ